MGIDKNTICPSMLDYAESPLRFQTHCVKFGVEANQKTTGTPLNNMGLFQSQHV